MIPKVDRKKLNPQMESAVSILDKLVIFDPNFADFVEKTVHNDLHISEKFAVRYFYPFKCPIHF